MFSFKAFSDPKLQTGSLFAYQAARNVMWANVLTRLKVAISWHINVLCVCTTARREFGWSIHVKNHNALIIVFLEMPLPIFRIAQEKTRVWWIQNTPHSLQTEATGEAFRGTAFCWVTEECGQSRLPRQTRVIGSFGRSEVLNNGGLSSGRHRPTLGCLAWFYLYSSSWDLRKIPSCGVYWRKNTAKWSCGSPICKYGPCQPNCSPCWQWFGPKSLSCPKNTGFPWGWFETRQGVVRQNR